MAFEKFIREDQMVARKKAFIILRPNQIGFNSDFVKEADLKAYLNAIVYVDNDNYKIGFKFSNDKDDQDSFALYTDSVKKNSRCIACRSLYKKYKWIENIAMQKDNDLKRLIPEYDKIEKKWIISLMPNFEKKVSNISQIAPQVQGIYRYIKDKEIVYIGKGLIKSRTNSPERSEWEFDTIEYSIINDAKSQQNWESYWLKRFVKTNNRLPIYNKIFGKKIKKS